MDYNDLGEVYASEFLSEYSDAVCHAGVKGMKWGVRRYQNKDGSLTPLGRARYGANEMGSSVKAKFKESRAKFKESRAKRAAARAEEAEAERIKALMKKPVSKLTASELAERQARRQKERDLLNVEKQISDMSSEPKDIAKRLAGKAFNDIAIPALVDVGKSLLTSKLKSLGLDALGLKNDLKINNDSNSAKTDKPNNGSNSDKTDKPNNSSKSAKPNKPNNDSSSAKADNTPGNSKSSGGKTSSETVNTPKSTVSNNNATSVSKLSTSGYKMASINELTGSKFNNSGAASVRSLLGSGYRMTPINRLTSSGTSSGRSYSDDFLNNFGDYKMRSLEDIEKYN